MSRKQITKEAKKKIYRVTEVESTITSLEEFENTLLVKKSRILFRRLLKEINDFGHENCETYLNDWSRQILRSASSIPLNLSEGEGRGGKQSKLFFYRIARGLAFETMTNLRIAPIELSDELKNRYHELCEMLTAEVKSLCRRVSCDFEDSESKWT